MRGAIQVTEFAINNIPGSKPNNRWPRILLLVFFLVCGFYSNLHSSVSNSVLLREHRQSLHEIAMHFHELRIQCLNEEIETEAFLVRLIDACVENNVIRSGRLSESGHVTAWLSKWLTVEISVVTGAGRAPAATAGQRKLVGRIDYVVSAFAGTKPQSMLLYSDGSTKIYYGGLFHWFHWSYVIFFTVAAVSFFFFREAWRCVKMGKLALDWPVVPGVVTRLEIGISSSSRYKGGNYYVDIKYQYSVEGQILVSEKMRTDSCREVLRKAEVNDFKDKYSEGAQVKVYYNPDDPSVAVLIPGVSKNMRSNLIMFGSFSVCFAAALVMAFLEHNALI